MKALRHLLLCISLLLTVSAHADTLSIAAAADLQLAMDALISDFKLSNGGAEITATDGASDNLATQILQGAPYDLFYSSDIGLPHQLIDKGLAAAPLHLYALGRIVLWSATLDASKMSLTSLADATITHIAIANPKQSAYGQRAEEALHASGLWDKLKPKLVYGENLDQTTQLVQTGNAQVGIIALSMALNPGLSSKGGYALIPEKLYSPMEQAYVITHQGSSNALAKRFAAYLDSAPAHAILTHYGFALPAAATQVSPCS